MPSEAAAVSAKVNPSKRSTLAPSTAVLPLDPTTVFTYRTSCTNALILTISICRSASGGKNGVAGVHAPGKYLVFNEMECA